MRTLVIQSFRTEAVPTWIEACMDSVRQWCLQQGHTWRFVDDRIFDLVPDWYLDKTGRGPVATDYARLVLMQQVLDTGQADRAIWLDADVYVRDPGMQLAAGRSCAFGRETWIQEDNGSLRARSNVHNAVCVFNRGCVVLPFLIDTVASIIRRADPDHIAPQMVGPKLLSALHSLYHFDLLPQVGAVSPALAADLAAGGGPALALWRRKAAVPMQAANLCASLMADAEADRVIANLELLA